MNTIFYAIMSGLICCSCMGLIYHKVFNVTVKCLQGLGCVHIALIIATAVYVFDAASATCMINLTVYNTETGDSFANDGSLLSLLWILQIALYIPFCCCSCMGMCFGSGVTQFKKAHDN